MFQKTNGDIMSIEKTLIPKGMTLKKFCEKNKYSQVTVQHAENERTTHIVGFINAANYELQDKQMIWYRKGSSLIKEVYKKPSVVNRITQGLRGRK